MIIFKGLVCYFEKKNARLVHFESFVDKMAGKKVHRPCILGEIWYILDILNILAVGLRIEREKEKLSVFQK